MLARRAARRIQRDLDHEPSRLSDDELLALPALESFTAFAALSQLAAGDLTSEAHALSLFVVLERMRIAEELPVHLKPYVVVEPFRAVFGVPVPTLPHDAAVPLPRGEWLGYLTSVAAYAHHPVTDVTRPFEIQHEAAVAGILEGIADGLRTEAADIVSFTPFAHEVQVTVRALDQSRLRASM